MIVECPQCESKYRIDDDRIPSGGGRIQCPECDAEIEFRLEDAPTENVTEMGVGETERLQHLADEMEGADVGSDDVGEADPTEIIDNNRAAAAADEGEIEENPTEIIDDGGAPGFLEEREVESAEDSGTIEMRNPFLGSHEDEGADADPSGADAEEQSTTELERDALSEMFLGDQESSEGETIPSGSPAGEKGPALHSYTGQSEDPIDESSGGPGDDERGEEIRADDVDVRVGDDAALDGPIGPTQERLRPTNERDAPTEGRQEDGDVSGDVASSLEQTPDGSLGSDPPDAGREQPSPSSARDAETAWTVRAPNGVTYDFSDIDVLRDWFSDRDDIGSLRVSTDGVNYFKPSAFPELSEIGGPPSGPEGASEARRASGPASKERPGGPPEGGGPPPLPPDSGGPPRAKGGERSSSIEAQAARKSGDSSGTQDPSSAPADWSRAIESAIPDSSDSLRTMGRRALYPILIVLTVVAFGIFLDISGIYPVGRAIPGIPSTFERREAEVSGHTENASGGGSTAPDEQRDRATDSDEEPEEMSRVDKVLASAKTAVEKERWQTAIEKLRAAKLLAPKRPETYELFAEVYEKLGEGERAERNRKKARELESAQNESSSDDGDEE